MPDVGRNGRGGNPHPHNSKLVHDRESAIAAGLRPFVKGAPSANPGGLSRERRELYRMIEQRHVPKVDAFLDAIHDKFLETGDAALARLWLEHVRGPVRVNKGAEIEAAVEKKVQDMVSSARAARAAREGTAIDVPAIEAVGDGD